MKSIKLKPVCFPNDDIFVCPPEFIDLEDDVQVEKPKNKTFSSTEQLKTILQRRQPSKLSGKKSKKQEDEDSVRKLSDWKGSASPRSSLKRKFTFKRKPTFVNESRNSLRSVSLNKTLEPVPQVDSFEKVFNSILVIERLKKKRTTTETKHATQENTEIENSIKAKIEKVNKEIKQLKCFFDENLAKLQGFRRDLEDLNRTHEVSIKEVSTQEAQELLFSDKARKKINKPGDESRYFIQKEKIRQQKQELHKNHQEVSEYYLRKIENAKGLLEVTKSKKQECKKALLSFREQMITLYCRALKDGKDVRSDGLRWIIKNLWKMNECVPLSAFPKFFDEEACHFLLLMAEKDLQLETYTKKLENLRKEIRNKRTKFSISNERELYRTIRSRLRCISQSSVGQYIDGRSQDEADSPDKHLESPPGDTKYQEFSSLKSQIDSLQEETKQSTVNEIKRITAIYQINPGENEKTGLFHLIKCLVGDKVREFYKFTQPSIKQNRYRVSKKLNFK